ESDLFVITVTILGYHDPVLGFVNPRVPPLPGEPIFMASDAMLADVLCRRAPGQRGAAHLGSLLSRAPDAVPVTLDATGFTSTHLAIIASTGAGKSYLAGVLLEELMQPHNRAAVLVIDPHAEYDTLVELQNHPAFSADGYKASVRIVRPKDIKVRVSSLDLGDLRYLLPNLSDKMHHELARTYNRVLSRYGARWTRAQFVTELRSGDSGQPITDPDQELDPTLSALIWRFESVFRHSSLFDDQVNLPLSELFKPGQCTVLQLNEIPDREQQVVVATLLRRLFEARKDTVRGLAKEGGESYLPYPAFVLVEEAHNYAPANAEIITTQVLKQVLSEGRKFGVAVGLISQRPGKLDSDVLSQCMTQCIMRIVNPVDQARVAESIESVGRDLLLELPALSKGQAIIAGASVNTPLLVRVRQRLTPHGAENPDAPAEWAAYFDPARERARARDEALPPGLIDRTVRENDLYR
ncbi:MAG: ATP-binding protein, partial [Chloroflexi bacterium]|nr:ATP-binding protein [Chloroflexota bacterium]